MHACQQLSQMKAFGAEMPTQQRHASRRVACEMIVATRFFGRFWAIVRLGIAPILLGAMHVGRGLAYEEVGLNGPLGLRQP